MTSRLKIYSLQDWCVADNYAVEGIAVYLAGLTPVYEDASFQYIRPALNTSIKIALPEGSTIKFTSHGGYVSIDENDETFYYYIMNVRYVAPRTVELELGLDTINTYWKDIKTQLTENDRHLIHRQHKDRFLDDTGARIIDRYPEEFQPALFPTGTPQQIENESDILDRTWYLVYKTENTNEDSQVNCYAYCNPRAQYTVSQSLPIQTWTASTIYTNEWRYFFANSELGTPSVTINGNTYTVGSNNVYFIRIHELDNSTIQVEAVKEDGTVLNLETGSSVAIESSLFYYSTATKETQINRVLEIGTRTNYPSGVIAAEYVESLGFVNRKDPTIIKILELPYAPFTPSFNGSLIDLPTGWSYDSAYQAFHLTALDLEFSDVIQSEAIMVQLRPLVKKPNISPNRNEPRHDWTYESKLYNSQFYGMRFLYDASTWEFKPEYFTWDDTSLRPRLKVTYKPSNGINSTNAFRFQTIQDTYHDNSDYPGYLVVSRDNQQPIYTSEYLNYLKYGKAYETNQADLAIGKTWLNTGLGIIGGAVSGFLMGSGAGAVVGAIMGAVTGAANAIMTTTSQINSLQQKEFEMQHQAMSIVGNNDLDIFRWYNGNRLCWNTYEPTEQMRGMLYNYFYYFGYADNTYSAIDVDSRIWWNFIQADIVYINQDMQQEFIEDIKERFRLGVTVMHKTANGYDWARDRENWEAKLFA